MVRLVYLAASLACIAFSALYTLEASGSLDWVEDQDPNPNGQSYVMASKDELLEKQHLVANKNNQFFIQETRDSYFYDFKDETWKNYRMDKGITYKSYVGLPITNCLDAKQAPSAGSISGQYKIGLTNAVDFNLALDLNIPNFVVGMSAEIENAISYTFSSLVSCTIPKGKYGQLIAYIQKGLTPAGKIADVEFIKDIGFEPTLRYTQVPPIPVLMAKVPSVVCRITTLGCPPKMVN